MTVDPALMTSSERRELAAVLLRGALVCNNTKLVEMLVNNITIIDRQIKNIDDTFGAARTKKKFPNHGN